MSITIPLSKTLVPPAWMAHRIMAGLVESTNYANIYDSKLLARMKDAVSQYMFEPRDLQTYRAVAGEVVWVLSRWCDLEILSSASTGAEGSNGVRNAIEITVLFKGIDGKAFRGYYTFECDAWSVASPK